MFIPDVPLEKCKQQFAPGARQLVGTEAFDCDGAVEKYLWSAETVDGAWLMTESGKGSARGLFRGTGIFIRIKVRLAW